MSEEIIDFENIKPTVPETNKVEQEDGTFKYIDRIYSRIFGEVYMIQKDGTKYNSKIDKRSIKLDDGTLNFVYHADGRWFDRCGMPIDKPKNLVTRDKKDGE